MKRITANEAAYIYNRILLNACRKIENGEYESARSELEFAASWQYNFNTDYNTGSIDPLISKLRRHYIADYEVTDKRDNSIIMLDSFAYDNRGLTQQYVRAFKALGYSLLFICTDSMPNMQPDTRKELAEYEGCKAIWLDKSQTIQERLEIIRQKVMAFHPSMMFLHFAPWDFLPIMSADACKGVEVYNINLTDHAFWPGVSFINYDLEFRPYGRTIDEEKRGFNGSQLINLPYYPIIPKNAVFEGFPDLPEDAFIIFSGGSFYKMFGAGDMFFKILQGLLDISDKVHILIAGGGDKGIMLSKLKNIRGRDRIFLIGNRHDISEVFKHCDIYLSTYPFFGGLMTQYAVYYEKPILVLENKNHTVEDVVNHFDNKLEVSPNLSSLLTYAKKLIDDKDYRYAEGCKNKVAMMDEKRFVSILGDILDKKDSGHFSHWTKTEISYNDIMAEALEREKNYGQPNTNKLWARYRWRMFFLFPKCFLMSCSMVVYYSIMNIKSKCL